MTKKQQANSNKPTSEVVGEASNGEILETSGATEVDAILVDPKAGTYEEELESERVALQDLPINLEDEKRKADERVLLKASEEKLIAEETPASESEDGSNAINSGSISTIKAAAPVKKELVANIEVKLSKESWKMIEDAKNEVILECSKMILRFSSMSESFENLLIKSNKLARIAEKQGDYALAGEFHNLHGALGAASNKLKNLSQKALDHVTKND